VAVPLTLKVFKGNQLVASRDYDRDIIKIGRLSSAHLCLDDDRVSRIHSVIEVGLDGSLSIVDMGSVEGTFVNGKRVNKGALAFGDSIKLGNTLIRVESSAGVPAVAPLVAGAGATATAAHQVPVAAPASLGAGAVAKAPQVASARVESPSPAPPAPAPTASAPAVQARTRPRRRLGTGPVGIEIRLLWGDQMVGEYFLGPGKPKRFTVGSAEGVDFEMGDGKLGAPSFVVVTMDGASATLRFTSSMRGEYQRRSGEEIMTLEEARRRGVASEEGGVLAVTLSHEDFAWVDLGGVVAEVFFQPAPRPVAAPWGESVDFTALNIFLVMFFLAALFGITAANRQAEGEAFDDELNTNQARIAKLLIKPPESQKNPILARYEKEKATGQMAASKKGDEGKMGVKANAPARNTRTAPRGDPSNKDQARMLLAKVFGGASTGGISTVFGHQGLGGELKSAMGGMFGAAPGDAAGLGGMGLRGSGSGGGGLANSIGIGAIGTRGKGGGSDSYGSGVGVLTAKKDVDIGITSSDPVVMGSLDKELIRKVIHDHRSQIKFCFESQLNRFPKLQGKVMVKFVITGEGHVQRSEVVDSTVGNPEMETCVANKVKLWEFPKPKGGGIVLVTYPFIFKPSGT
jgi:TonB family protein